MSYEIVENGKAIKCLTCGKTSWSQGDIEHKFCGHCDKFHDDQVLPDTYAVPDYDDECLSCGQSPTVSVVKKGKLAHQMHLCGPCCFGTAAAVDPSTW